VIWASTRERREEETMMTEVDMAAIETAIMVVEVVDAAVAVVGVAATEMTETLVAVAMTQDSIVKETEMTAGETVVETEEVAMVATDTMTTTAEIGIMIVALIVIVEAVVEAVAVIVETTMTTEITVIETEIAETIRTEVLAVHRILTVLLLRLWLLIRTTCMELLLPTLPLR
jgi:hypothetical protein